MQRPSQIAFTEFAPGPAEQRHSQDELRSDVAAHGATAETDRPYVENARFGGLLTSATVDWKMLGAITQVLLANESLAAPGAGEM
ncbi:hypothetical protein [Streptomyces hokutonensis]|uniref:Uncharacterized protein n=1 Tax=Streptomyces hokutonensis TaxID=1306990 RepID=A0ABW6M5S6_9ACTN